ncbi:hypothetical protein SLT67_04620 [Paenibacillus illinoisensis]|uniref:hypothetical protein n=1 Tax=Paenibacillus illinoisensis TaxID=59845 RepID=UPI003CEEBA25
MSDKQTLSILLPLLIIAIFVCYIAIRLLFIGHTRLILNVILRYISVSILICLSFSMIYSLVGINEITLAKQANVIVVDNMPGFNIEGITKTSVLIDFLFYSFAIYFHMPSQFSIEGMTRIASTLQGLLGIIVPLIITFITFNEAHKSDKQKKLLHTFLNRGWDILRTRKNYSGKTRSIELIGPMADIKYVFVDDINDYKDELESFKVNWDTVDVKFLPFFLRLLEEPLRETNTSLSIDSQILFSKRDIESIEFWLEFKLLLETISKEASFIVDFGSFQTIDQVLVRLRQVIQTISEESTNEDIVDA